jgi:hypothetical protein
VVAFLQDGSKACLTINSVYLENFFAINEEKLQ